MEREGSDMEAEAIKMNEIDCDKRKDREKKREVRKIGREWKLQIDGLILFYFCVCINVA